ncbi:hypothetical protein CI238_00787 [Colletotrichum incanum]|uniref:Uncharacterized protein n=1 Tax=Colletotrichum incanum TaxID=1573173 RepID=A0A161YBK3_COLIC|nr:hypothetical protein CI238_00787 [Colletotrichum incanum]OHW90777.1 hypothetical protein CSPAE12_10595 [Colletotrichum incanum]
MKLASTTAPFFALVTAVLGLPTVPETTPNTLQPYQAKAPTCLLKGISEDAHPELFFGLQYYITAMVPADKIMGVCRAFMDDLESTRHCRGQFIGAKKPICRGDQRGLKIKLWTYRPCGQDMVHRAWFHATQNKYGPIECDTMDDIWN